jgi:hypothetical protein
VKKDVGVQGTEEEKRRGPRVLDADDTGGGGAAEVAGQDLHPAAGRAVGFVGIERDDERPRALVHVDGEVRRDGVLDERHETLRKGAEDDARIGGGIDGRERGDEFRHLDLPRPHGLGEQGLLRIDVTEHGRRRDAELLRDAGQRRRLVSPGGKDAGSRGEELLAGDARRTSHR